MFTCARGTIFVLPERAAALRAPHDAEMAFQHRRFMDASPGWQGLDGSGERGSGRDFAMLHSPQCFCAGISKQQPRLHGCYDPDLLGRDQAQPDQVVLTEFRVRHGPGRRRREDPAQPHGDDVVVLTVRCQAAIEPG